MTFALRGVLGLSVLSLVLTTAVGCDDGGQETTGAGGTGIKPVPTGGTGATAGTTGTGATAGTTGTGGTSGSGGSGSGGSAGTGVPSEGVPLTPDAGGWVDGMSNTLGIQGAMFAYADDTTKMSMMGTCPPTATCETPFTVNAGPPAAICIQGAAAKVDMMCTPVAPATDCYGTYWGAAIGLNLNQPIDPATEMGADPMPFDAVAAGIKGFAFDITGDGVPGPGALRFKIEDANGEYCTTSSTPVALGPNTFTLDQLVTECWTTGGTPSPATGLLKIAWQVVTNASSEVPFNFCVSNVRAVTM
jgi:hypothetical protein